MTIIATKKLVNRQILVHRYTLHHLHINHALFLCRREMSRSSNCNKAMMFYAIQVYLLYEGIITLSVTSVVISCTSHRDGSRFLTINHPITNIHWYVCYLIDWLWHSIKDTTVEAHEVQSQNLVAICSCCAIVNAASYHKNSASSYVQIIIILKDILSLISFSSRE